MAPITQRFLDQTMTRNRSTLRAQHPRSTPASLGYRMPAEWEPHAATWIAWPHNRDDWPGKFAPVPWVYAEIVRHLSRVERVNIVVRERRDATPGGRPARRRGRRPRAGPVLQGGDRPGLAPRLGPDVRRQGRPAPTADDRVGLIDWKFNAWAKYDNHRHDDRLPRKLSRWLGLRRWVPRVEQGGEPAAS